MNAKLIILCIALMFMCSACSVYKLSPLEQENLGVSKGGVGRSSHTGGCITCRAASAAAYGLRLRKETVTVADPPADTSGSLL